MRGSCLPHAKFSLESVILIKKYTMGIMFGMFLFAFRVFNTKKCEAVIFTKFELACMYTRPLEYLDTIFLHRACAPCMLMHIVHPKHDVTRFTYNVNHVIMTSLSFAFHLCHVGMRWHDIIGVRVA